MTLRTKPQLLTDAGVGFPDGQNQGNTSAKIRDLIESLVGVYGHLALSSETAPHVCNNDWQTFAEWTSSRDTNGLSENLATGEYTLTANADGTWESMSLLLFSVNTTGNYRMRPRIIHADDTEGAMGADSARNENLNAGDKAQWSMIGMNTVGQELVAGDRLVLQVRGPVNAEIVAYSGFFRCERK